MKKRSFPVKGPLDETDIAVYDKAVRYFRCGPTYIECKSSSLKEALAVDFGLYMVELHNKYHKNGRCY
jgi:hypothetical protein